MRFRFAPIVILFMVADALADGDSLNKFFSSDESPMAESNWQATAWQLLGHAHYALVHFPIVLALVLPFLEFFSPDPFGSGRGRKIRDVFWLLTCGAFLAAVATGWTRSSAFAEDASVWPLIHLHRNLALSAMAFCIVSFLGVRKLRSLNAHRGLLLALPITIALLALATAFVGGEIAFGPWMQK